MPVVPCPSSVVRGFVVLSSGGGGELPHMQVRNVPFFGVLVGDMRYALSEETNVPLVQWVNAHAPVKASTPKTLLRMNYNLLHGGTDKFPRTKHISSPQHVPFLF